MQRISFYLALPFLYLISLSPFWLLYAISDFFCFLLFRVFKYRKKVVWNNLKNSFPNKPDAELNQIMVDFYHYLCDLTLETFKTLTFSKKQAAERCRFTPESLQLFERLHAENKSVIIVMGHYGNWEWGGSSMSICTDYQLYVIYHPLSNPYFDRLIYKMRTRFGTKLIAMHQTLKEMIRNRGELSATAFIADQTPQPENAYWMQFLNQDTPVFVGTEKIAKKLGYPVVYANVIREKRGYYRIELELLVEDPKNSLNGEITELHTKRLEEQITKMPFTWLWSHKRWKHKRK